MSTSKTAISWTDRTWNPVRGCSLVSPGCTNCYAQKQAHRFSGKGQPYEGLTRMTEHGPVWTGKIRTVPEALDEPLHWRKPARIFVNSMSDLFHEDVPFEFIDRVMAVISRLSDDSRPRTPADMHQFQVLTKRAERMRDYMNDELVAARVCARRFKSGGGSAIEWPPSNLWLLVSAEDQKTLDERTSILLQTRAAVRGISLEPLLERVDVAPLFDRCSYYCDHGDEYPEGHRPERNLIDWVIVGGESGPDARPCEIDWIRSLVTQCDYAQVPCFVKQFGSRPMGYLNGALVPWPNHHSKGTDLGAIPGHWPQEFPR